LPSRAVLLVIVRLRGSVILRGDTGGDVVGARRIAARTQSRVGRSLTIRVLGLSSLG
jgi:hypothetical protein